MSRELYSLDQVAGLLGLHVRTVRNYVRAGRLKAIRIGKQYRIAPEDFAALTGQVGHDVIPGRAERPRHAEVSSIIDIDAISPDAASRISNGLLAAAKNHERKDQPLRIETIYSEERLRLKIILTGSIGTVRSFLGLIAVYLDE